MTTVVFGRVLFTRFLFQKYLLGIGLALLCSACFSPKAALRHIPQETPLVVKTNLLGVAVKLAPYQDFFAEEIKDLLPSAFNDSIQNTKLLKRVKRSGVNLMRMYTHGTIFNEESNYLVMTAPLLRAKRFQRVMEHLLDSGRIQKTETSRYQYTFHERMALTWDKRVVMLCYMPHPTPSVQPLALLDSLFARPAQTSVWDKHRNFRQANRQWSESMLWLNMGALRQTPFMQNLIGDRVWMQTLPFEDNYLRASLQFGESSIRMDVRYTLPDSVARRYRRFLKKSLDPSLVDNAPIQDPALVGAIGVNMKDLPHWLKKRNFYEAINNVAAFVDLEGTDLLQMMRGDLAFFVKDIHRVYENGKERLKLDYALGLGVQNQETLNNLFTLLKESGLLVEKNGLYTFFEEYFLIEKGNILYLTNSENIHRDFVGNEALQQKNITALAQTHSLMLFADESLTSHLSRPRYASLEGSNAPQQGLRLPIKEVDLFMRNISQKHVAGMAQIKLTSIENALITLYKGIKPILLGALHE
jgi:hypothetical protein